MYVNVKICLLLRLNALCILNELCDFCRKRRKVLWETEKRFNGYQLIVSLKKFNFSQIFITCCNTLAKQMSWMIFGPATHWTDENVDSNVFSSACPIWNKICMMWSWCKIPLGDINKFSNVPRNDDSKFALKNCRSNSFQRSCKHCKDVKIVCVICGSIVWANACPYVVRIASKCWACSGWSSSGIGWSLAPGENPRNTCDL